MKMNSTREDNSGVDDDFLPVVVAKKVAKKQTGGKVGRKVFNENESDGLLDAVEDVLPLGSNEWAINEVNNDWAHDRARAIRDAEKLIQRFDRIDKTQKKTGTSGIKPWVRRVKEIARDIHGRCVSASLGGGWKDGREASSAEYQDEKDTVGSTDDGEDEGEPSNRARIGRSGGRPSDTTPTSSNGIVTSQVRSRVGKRPAGMKGVCEPSPKKTKRDPFRSCVQLVA